MITADDHDRLAEMPVVGPDYERYTALAAILQREQGPGPGLVKTTQFVRAVYPSLMDQSPTRIAQFYRWVALAAQHQGAAAGSTTHTAKSGFAKGKTVTQYLWRKPVKAAAVSEFL